VSKNRSHRTSTRSSAKQEADDESSSTEVSSDDSNDDEVQLTFKLLICCRNAHDAILPRC
jgi:hypothetical protein